MFSSKMNVIGVGSGVQYLEAWLHDLIAGGLEAVAELVSGCDSDFKF